MLQVLSKEEYACWLRRHLEAETAIQGREELLFESALRLETDLHLLGQKRSCSALRWLINALFSVPCMRGNVSAVRRRMRSQKPGVYTRLLDVV